MPIHAAANHIRATQPFAKLRPNGLPLCIFLTAISVLSEEVNFAIAANKTETR